MFNAIIIPSTVLEKEATFRPNLLNFRLNLLLYPSTIDVETFVRSTSLNIWTVSNNRVIR